MNYPRAGKILQLSTPTYYKIPGIFKACEKKAQLLIDLEGGGYEPLLVRDTMTKEARKTSDQKYKYIDEHIYIYYQEDAAIS